MRLRGSVRANWLERSGVGPLRRWMRNPFRYFKTSPEIIRLAVMMYVRMDQVLGHKDGKVGAVYDRYAYFDEKCRALDGWSRELRRILNGAGEGSKVIPLYG
jgi:hypothetical protein